VACCVVPSGIRALPFSVSQTLINSKTLKNRKNRQSPELRSAADPEILKEGRRRCIRLGVIYRKCTQRTMCWMPFIRVKAAYWKKSEQIAEARLHPPAVGHRLAAPFEAATDYAILRQSEHVPSRARETWLSVGLPLPCVKLFAYDNRNRTKKNTRSLTVVVC